MLVARALPGEQLVLVLRTRSVVPGQRLAEADEFAVCGRVDLLGEHEVDDRAGGLVRRLGVAEIVEPWPRRPGVYEPGETAAISVPSARSLARRPAATARTATTWATFEGTLTQRGQPCSRAVPV
jgi:hypothetical protein